MYKGLKKIAKTLVPQKILKKNDSFFRKIVSLAYSGNKHLCNTCNKTLSQFVVIFENELLCPNCGSLSRTRRLYDNLTKTNTLKGRVLHFSPNKVLYNKFKTLNLEYYSTDFEDEFVADYCYDIIAIPITDNFFDLIICYHVLEHIENDLKAMSELFRVLKPNGICYIQTPFKEGEIFEDSTITHPLDREQAFGQKDHVRIYSAEGLNKRLKSVGFSTTLNHYKEDLYLGFKNETVIVATKRTR